MNCKNTYNHPLSRVRARAHSQEFYCFCCHKCHRLLHKSLNNNTLQPYFKQLLTLRRYTPSKYAHRDSEKQTFYPSIFAVYPSFFVALFLTFCPPLWHLWQQKIKIVVECARVTRAHEKASSHCFCFFHFSLGARRSKHTFTPNSDTSTSQYEHYK